MADGTITQTSGAPPIPQPKKQARTKGNQQALANLANQQLQGEIAAVQALIDPAAATIAQLHAAVPGLIHAEAMQRLEAQIPLIEQENQRIIDDAAVAGKAAIAESRTAANEFLSTYGLSL